MSSGQISELDAAIDSLRRAIAILNNNDWGSQPIGGKYGELLVAKQLWSSKPLLGRSRKKRSADIYLQHLQKGIEVKWGIVYETPFTWWGWGFGSGNQIRRRKFDICVLLAGRKDGTTAHQFVITTDEMQMLRPRAGGIPENRKSYFLLFSEKWEEFKRFRRVPQNELEERINLHPDKFDNRWDKVSMENLK